MLNENQKHWGVDQWAAFLSARALPCMPRSKARLLELEAELGDSLSAHDLANLAGADPFLCLHLLREAESHRAQRLGHETSTPLGAVMQLGTDTFHKLLLESPATDESNQGLAECEARSHLASRLALRWGAQRADVSPDEIAMAALLAEIGELLLWSFAPELPLNALAALESGHSPRSVQAQVDTCGFRFKDLTLKCATIWHLPPLLTQLIRGIDNTRSSLSRLCVDTARHLSTGGANDPALPSDIADAKHIIPGASLEWLTEQLPGLNEEEIAHIVLKAGDLVDLRPPLRTIATVNASLRPFLRPVSLPLSGHV
ncbi:MAG: HDOD domain-containing protein [Betaproteobacteria bacterium]|nr:HDOD domain-containing protein [Betaproteobacteria bacterium]